VHVVEVELADAGPGAGLGAGPGATEGPAEAGGAGVGVWGQGLRVELVSLPLDVGGKEGSGQWGILMHEIEVL
jgi:hypothetical protein